MRNCTRPSALLLSAALHACATDSDTTSIAPPAPASGTAGSSSTPPITDMQPADAAPVSTFMTPGLVCSGELPVMTILDTATSSEAAPDWTCYAQAQLQTPPARDVTFSLAKSVPALIGNIEGLVADLFFGPSTLGTPSVTLKFSAGQTAQNVNVPAGLTQLSAHMHALTGSDPRYDTVDLHDYDLRVPDTGVMHGTTAMEQSFLLAAHGTYAGADPDPTKASLVAEARDCQGRDVGGAQFELTDGETNQPVPFATSGTGTRQAYSQFALPNVDCTFTTSGRAEWMVFNVPTNVSGDKLSHRYHLQLKGRMHDSDREPVVLGEHDVELFPGATTTARLFKQTDACRIVSGALDRCL